MSARTRWLDQTGARGTSRVVVQLNRGGDRFVLRWWDKAKQNWAQSTLEHIVVERDARGEITRESRALAIAAAQQKSLELAGQVAARIGSVEKKALAIADAEKLITDPDTGKYPHPGQFRDEISRALRLAAATWGADTLWSEIEESHYVMLLRRRLEALLVAKRRGVRATEITISRIITTVRWLRAAKHIPRDAAPWPEDWKEEIVKHWKGVTKSARGPETFQPRHTHKEAIAILRASGFDPRFELLMWLGMDLRLGQVARARRTDLELTTGDALAAGDYGRFTVHGAGKKGGTVVALTAGQRRVIEQAFTGYLAKLETQYQAEKIDDYLLFPAGYVAGRVARTRGRDSVPLKLGEKISTERHVVGSWIRKNFLIAEQMAKVEHVKGRGAYGLRRQSVDVGAGEHLSPSGLQALGGWSDTKIPLSVYAEKTNKAGQLEARSVRAKLRGEE